MHRSFEPLHPSTSRLLSSQREADAYDRHRRALGKVKPVVDTGAPRSHPHLRSKSKKKQQEKERLTEIERDNRLLLEKMSGIMAGQGQVDHVNRYEECTQRSLNRGKRKRELERITRENERMLRALQARQPSLSRRKWDKEHEKSEYLKKQITRFPLGPPVLGDSPGRRDGERAMREDAYSPDDGNEEYEDVDEEGD